MEYPKVFEDLINSFRKLPGVGAKTAESNESSNNSDDDDAEEATYEEKK